MDRGVILILLAFSVAVSTAAELTGQKLPFRSYSIEQGLSESVVHSLLQDSDDYLWIGTGYGLNRFDGTEIVTFHHHHGMNDNQINTIVEDDRGRLWIGTDSGINIMDEDSVRSPTYLEDLKRYSIIAMYKDRSEDWWFGTDGAGVWLLDGDNELTQYRSVHGLAGDRIRAIVQDDRDVLWFATDEGLTNLDAGNFTTFTTGQGLPGNNLSTLEVGEEGRLWIGTDRGLSILNDGEFVNYGIEDGLIHNSVLSISVYGSMKAWIGTDEGASRFEEGEFEHFTAAQGLTSNIINETLIDREGNVWFGTLGGGANIYLGDYFHNYSEDEGLSNNVITGFDEDRDGNIWIASFANGVMRYDGDEFSTFNLENGLIDNRTYAVYSDRSGRVWVGTRSGISIIENGSVIQPPDRFRGLDMVRVIYEDPDTGEFWIGTYNDGLFRFTDEGVQRYDDSNVLGNNTVMSIDKDHDGRLWIATYGGLMVYDEGEFSSYTIDDGLPSNGVIRVMIDHENQPWISTFNGFARVDREHGEIETFRSTFDLSTTLAYFMFQDNENNYWVGTNIGIIRFDPDVYRSAESNIGRDLAYELINREQGLIANEMNAGAIFKDLAGSIWLGTVEGISRFYPERLPVRAEPPLVHFKEIVFAGQTVRADRKITRRHDRNFVQLELTGISFAAPSRVLFEYRLEGVDDEWTHTYNRSVRYPSLSPGEYSFQVRAYNSSGIRSQTAGNFDFEIKPPFWLQWWFFLLIGLFLAAVLFFIYNFYKVRRLMEMERMRVQIASDLHDDVGASLTELALQTDFLRTGNLEESIEQTLKEIGEHSRRIVSTLDDIVWSIDARNDTAGDLTDRMQDHANRLLSPNGVTVNFDFSELDTGLELPVQVKENLYLIFKESINNIAKHSNADTVDVSLRVKNSTYELVVIDNGTVQPNGRKTGQGIRNINMRAKRMDANAIIDRENGFHIKVEGTM